MDETCQNELIERDGESGRGVTEADPDCSLIQLEEPLRDMPPA